MKLSVNCSYGRWRKYKDKATTFSISFGGISIVLVITLMFVFMVSKVLPLFTPGKMHLVTNLSIADLVSPEADAPASALIPPLYLNIEEQKEVAMRIDKQGTILFFHSLSGALIKQVQLNLPQGIVLTQVIPAPDANLLLLSLSNGQALLLEHKYLYEFDAYDKRTIVPEIVYPFGESFIRISEGAPRLVAFAADDDQLVVAAYNSREQLRITKLNKETNFLTGEFEFTVASVVDLEEPVKNMDFLAIDGQHRWLFAARRTGELFVYSLNQESLPKQGEVNITEDHARITKMQSLLGGSSLIVATDQGDISQWVMVRDANNNFQLTKIKNFVLEPSDNPSGNTPVKLIPAQRSKDFIVLDQDNRFSYFNATAANLVFSYPLASRLADSAGGVSESSGTFIHSSIAPRGDMFIAETHPGQISVWAIENHHSDVSLASLWNRIWYEGYDKPEYIWQSSASSNDSEPKYSLVPLVFGTVKATFYTLILSAPIAILSAMYTAYFMAPALRRKVKPLIELMGAIPTVVLGFFAGLVLSPFMGSHLPGILLLLLLLPLGIIAFGLCWSSLPASIQHLIPDSWHALLLVPVILCITILCFTLSQPVEALLFAGDMKQWLMHDLGINYDQRNALVVGIAMGFAVIPTIFSIAEDGLFAVPKHLVNGSLALGASQWQTMLRVILPTASPAIFSALMIGLGRAVGETMIILMATGNTPIMDMNLFEGMRTLAANIAVEIPESAVNSSHYRILFLSGLILFCLTFVINSIAEHIRYKLRKKYSSL